MGGDWVRGRCLGHGSTAAVYLAASTSGKREPFAVKTAELSRSAPLQREEKILSSLRSTHVVSCLGSDVKVEPDGRVFYNLFMEYVPGGCLADAIKRDGGLDEHIVRVYTRGILHGLAYLHSRGIVHCDIKGHNILVSEDGESVKLADLGCARRVDIGSDGGVVISGTPLYMAPETARGEEQGPAADIWALGCTVIEMATGCPPWRDVADPVAAIHRIAFSGNVPEFPCNVSDDAKDFLGKCLSRDPRERWSAEELLNHPFVNHSEEFTTGCVSISSRNSPRTTLDHDFWDSWQDEEEEEEENAAKLHMDNQPLGSAQDRLWQLVSPPPAANATWEESCWVTIRNNEGSESPAVEDEASTISSWLVERGVDGVGSMEESAARHDCSVATTEGYLPSNTSLRSFGFGDDVDTSYWPSAGHDRNDLAEAHSFPGGFTRQITLISKDYEYPTCNDLGHEYSVFNDIGILQEIVSGVFASVQLGAPFLLFPSCYVMISPLLIRVRQRAIW